MIDLRIVSGTDRPNSNAYRIARYLQQRYEEQGVNVKITDLCDFPLKHVAGGKYGEDIPAVDAFVKPLIEADGLVIVCPEYNGSYPGILKMFIDYFPYPASLNKKPIALVGEATGAFGAMRAVEQLQQVFGYRHAHIFPERVFISRVDKNFDEGGIKNEFQQQLLDSQIENFPAYVRDLKEGSMMTGNVE